MYQLTHRSFVFGYDEEMQSSTALALQRLYDKNKKILQLCKELLSNVPINDLENALKVLDRISHYDLVFDNSAISILIEKAVVTKDANMIFYYIDGSKITAEALGVRTVDADIIHSRLTLIQAKKDNTLVFGFKDGTQAVKQWQDRSRAESWTEEKKENARKQRLARTTEN